jgi:hypothetical protein
MVRCDEQEIDAQAHVHGEATQDNCLVDRAADNSPNTRLTATGSRGWSNSNRSRRHASDISKSLDPSSSLYGISSTLLVTMIEPPVTGHRLDFGRGTRDLSSVGRIADL